MEHQTNNTEILDVEILTEILKPQDRQPYYFKTECKFYHLSAMLKSYAERRQFQFTHEEASEQVQESFASIAAEVKDITEAKALAKGYKMFVKMMIKHEINKQFKGK